MHRPVRKERGSQDLCRRTGQRPHIQAGGKHGISYERRSIPLTTPYGLQMKKDSVDVYLPYYGRAYQIPYGGGEGLRFKAPVENYSSKLKKDRYRITFEATTSEDNFRFSVDLYDDGSANIHVTMRNRQLFTTPDSSMQPSCSEKCLSLRQRNSRKQ